MTHAQRLSLRSSEIRARLNEIAGLPADQLNDEIRSESDRLTAEYADVERQFRAAVIAESEGLETRNDGGQTAEERELADLERRASVGEVFQAAVDHAHTDGATKELQDHYGVGMNAVPLSLLETRAVTPAPSDVGQNQAPIIPGVFPMSVASFLGVNMPTVGVGEAVFPVLATNATVHTPAESADAGETTGSFTADVLSPSRLQASFFYSREDRARFKGMAEALRENLNMALGDALDKQVISGTNGLLTGTNLANNNVNAVTSFANYITNLVYGRIDGTYASVAGDIRIVAGAGTYAHAGNIYRNNNVDRTALDRLMEVSGGVRVSTHVPAVAGNKQNVIVRRGMRKDMCAPIWEGIQLIADEVTKAKSGEIVITAVMLHAVKILRAGGFSKQQTQHA